MNGLDPRYQHSDPSGSSIPLLDVDQAEKVGENNVYDSHSSLSTSPLRRVAEAYLQVQDSAPTLLVSPSMLAGKLPSVSARFMHALIPSFIQSWLKNEQKQEKLLPTAYLDGMRGLAAFGVFICHLSYQSFFITFGYGAGLPGENDYLIQLPIIKLLYSGPPMVAIFFIISGYALSLKPLKQMRAHQWEGLMHTMSSSVFRRTIRLYLPCVASTLLVLLLVRMGVYEYNAAFSTDKKYLPAMHEDHVPTLDTFYNQFSDWAAKFFDFVHFWDFGLYSGSLDYDRHLWTIPTEFRASMVLFLSLMLTARMTPFLRISTFAFLAYWALQWDRWEMILFWFGPILAELDLIRSANNTIVTTRGGGVLQTNTPSSKALPNNRLRWWFYVCNFICGLYLASYPDSIGEATPGYVYLSMWIPEAYSQKLRFWQSVGSIQLIWATNNLDSLKGLFTGPAVQYLGKLSYALYLMHGPVIHSFGYFIMPYVWDSTGVERRWNYEVGFFLNAILIIIMTIWVSDIFWRFVDVPIVKFGRWFESKCIVPL